MTTTTTKREFNELMKTIKHYLKDIETAQVKQDNAITIREYDEALLEAQNIAYNILKVVETMGHKAELLININEPDINAVPLHWNTEITFK